MRELELPEIEMVAGGFGFEDDPTDRQDTITVTGIRTTRRYLGVTNIGGGAYDIYDGPGDSFYILPPTAGGGPISDEDLLDPALVDLLDEMSGGAYSAGDAAGEAINGATGNTGDYAFRDEICNFFNQPDDICELYENP